MNELSYWRHNKPMQFPNMNNNRIYPATKMFDQLTYIGDEIYCCYALETSAGVVLIDAMWPGPKYTQMIEQGIKEIGHKPSDVIAILLTHGHPDHIGSPNHWIDNYGTKVYLSEIDYFFGLNFKPAMPDGPGFTQLMECREINYVEDMQDLTFGETTVKAILTPGHTPGGLSYIIPVTDEGRPHYAALWGGNGIPRDKESLLQYKYSLEHFSAVCDEMNVDVEISNHPFVDMTIPRLEILRNITAGVAHPFVIGKDQYHRYEQMYFDRVAESLKALEENRQ